MSKKNIGNLKPFLSILMIVASLFTLAFLQMETRRMGYVVLKMSREYKRIQDENRILTMRLAKMNRPEHLRDVAMHRLTLDEAKSGQIIHISGNKIALRQ